jgi:hypothetical protein
MFIGTPKRIRGCLRARLRRNSQNAVDESGKRQRKVCLCRGPGRIHQASCGAGEGAGGTEEVHPKFCRQGRWVSPFHIKRWTQLTLNIQSYTSSIHSCGRQEQAVAKDRSRASSCRVVSDSEINPLHPSCQILLDVQAVKSCLLDLVEGGAEKSNAT